MFIQSFNFFVFRNVLYLLVWNFEREVVDRLGEAALCAGFIFPLSFLLNFSIYLYIYIYMGVRS